MPQLNIRISDELLGALQAHVQSTGEKQSAAVRRGITMAIGQRVEARDIPPHSPPAAESSPEGIASESRQRGAAPRAKDSGQVPAAPSGGIDFATWLAGRTGMPRAILVRRIIAGKVEVDGRPRYAEKIEAADLRGQVTLDGNPV